MIYILKYDDEKIIYRARERIVLDISAVQYSCFAIITLIYYLLVSMLLLLTFLASLLLRAGYTYLTVCMLLSICKNRHLVYVTILSLVICNHNKEIIRHVAHHDIDVNLKGATRFTRI
jgi:hypothetical protein